MQIEYKELRKEDKKAALHRYAPVKNLNNPTISIANVSTKSGPLRLFPALQF